MALVIKGILSPEQEAAGLSVEEESDHLVLLKDGDDVVAAFSQLAATPEAIRMTAAEWLKGAEGNKATA